MIIASLREKVVNSVWSGLNLKYLQTIEDRCMLDLYVLVVGFRREIWVQIKLAKWVIKATGVGEITHRECVK